MHLLDVRVGKWLLDAVAEAIVVCDDVTGQANVDEVVAGVAAVTELAVVDGM